MSNSDGSLLIALRFGGSIRIVSPDGSLPNVSPSAPPQNLSTPIPVAITTTSYPHGLDSGASAALVGGGVLLGWLGSFIVATRELRGIEPK